jgi:hypothetical protein
MLKLSAEIQVFGECGMVFLHRLHDVNVITNVENLTDTATITFPRSIQNKGKPITDFVKKDDKIVVRLGYDDDLFTVFRGYVKQVLLDSPMKLVCENEAYKLKQIKVAKGTRTQFSILQFCKEYIDNEQYVTEAKLDKVVFANDLTVLEVLSFFKKNYGFLFYYRDEEDGCKFYGNMSFSEMTRQGNVNDVKFKKGCNIISSTVKTVLAEDNKIQIVGKSMVGTKKIEVKYPDTVGEGYNVRTHHWFECRNEAQLMEKAKAEFKNSNKDTINGDITAFGIPFVRKGDIIHLYDDEVVELNDKRFFAKAVTYSWGVSGYRQTITLGGRV